MVLNIEIICKPCRKCELLAERVKAVIESMQQQKQIKISHSLRHNKNVREAEKFGYNLLELPLFIVNGHVEFVGHVKEVHLIRMKFEEIMRNC